MWFGRTWQKLLRGSDTDGASPSPAGGISEIKYAMRSNVVMHCTAIGGARRGLLHNMLGRAWPSKTPASPALRRLRADKRSSAFLHFRFTTQRSGKILAFATTNAIRAGKHTHGDAVCAAMRFQRWLHLTTAGAAPPWVTAISTPNAVITGQLGNLVTNKLKNSWTAAHSDKFPGIAVTVPGLPGVTPEVFCKQGKFIVPGVRQPGELLAALQHVSELQRAD